jgi:DNA repair protein RecO (recombination protein O)
LRLLSAEGWLLDVVDLQELDRIVTFITPEHGLKRGVANGARRKFSRFAGQLQLLSRAAIRWREKDGRELVRIDGVEVIRAPGTFLEDLEGILYGSCMAEHLVLFAQENEDSELYVRLLSSTLEALEGSPVSRALALRYFEVWTLRLAGIFPVPEECPLCANELRSAGATLPRHGEGLVCQECDPGSGGALPIRAATLEFLRTTGSRGIRDVAATKPTASTLAQVEEVCGRVRRNFLGHELRSYGVMRATLGDRATA